MAAADVGAQLLELEGHDVQGLGAAHRSLAAGLGNILLDREPNGPTSLFVDLAVVSLELSIPSGSSRRVAGTVTWCWELEVCA